jgi:hypothetical protein
MTRPATLFSVAERVAAGAPVEIAVPEFLDTFYTNDSVPDRIAMLADEPPPTGSDRHDALLAAIAEYLSRQHKLGVEPGWASAPCRTLDRPWFTTSSDSDAMREYLVFSSPAEFRQRNIFTEAMPLRRARGPRPAAE